MNETYSIISGEPKCTIFLPRNRSKSHTKYYIREVFFIKYSLAHSSQALKMISEYDAFTDDIYFEKFRSIYNWLNLRSILGIRSVYKVSFYFYALSQPITYIA